MFIQKPTEPTELEKTLDALFAEMSGWPGDSEEFSKMADQVAKLYKLKEVDTPKQLSPDVLLTVTANIFGIILITRYEQLNVLTSKAMQFIKLR